MKREFKAGEVIFHYDYLNDDLHGFGKVLKDVVTENDDDIILIEVNNSGECETTADRVYKIATRRICHRCGCVVLAEHGNIGYPYYCPDHDENLYNRETDFIGMEQFKECLKDSIGRFLPEEDE